MAGGKKIPALSQIMMVYLERFRCVFLPCPYIESSQGHKRFFFQHHAIAGRNMHDNWASEPVGERSRVTELP